MKCFVTFRGEVIEPGGTILVGKGGIQIGLISRKTELEKIKSELTRIVEEIESSVEERRIKEIEVKALLVNPMSLKEG